MNNWWGWEACINNYSSRVSTLYRVGGGRTARKFRQGCIVLRGNWEMTEIWILQYCPKDFCPAFFLLKWTGTGFLKNVCRKRTLAAISALTGSYSKYGRLPSSQGHGEQEWINMHNFLGNGPPCGRGIVRLWLTNSKIPRLTSVGLKSSIPVLVFSVLLQNS